MSKNLTAQVKNSAKYLPALPLGYSEYVIKPNDPELPASLKPRHLNFLNHNSPLWHYKFCLPSAGYFAYSEASNAITQRKPNTTVVVGDSGGYQVGSGKLRKIKPWSRHRKNFEHIIRLWNESDIRHNMLRWLEKNCDYAMTLDMPLWVREARWKTSPFHYCSLEQLTGVNVDNLKFIDTHRGAFGHCKFLNVIQGQNETEEDYWYQRVCPFDCEGWAFGTKLKWESGIDRILKRILLLRDDGMLCGRKEWLHILGVSQLKWAVALTAIQRGIQQSTGSPFTVSFDSSTPFRMAGINQTCAVPPKLTENINSWRIPAKRFPVGRRAATVDADKPFPEGSPISSLLTIGDMNPRTSAYAANTFGRFSPFVLGNHNLYVYLRAFIDANDAAFNGGAVPQPIADLVGLVEDLFAAEQWQTLLERNATRLRELFGKPTSAEDVNELSY